MTRTSCLRLPVHRTARDWLLKKAERIGSACHRSFLESSFTNARFFKHQHTGSMTVGVHQVDRVVGHTLHARLQSDRAGSIVE